MSRLATENVLTNPADRLPFTYHQHLHNTAHALQTELRREWLHPARLPVVQVLDVDAHSDKAERPGLTTEAFTAPRSTATGNEDGCFPDCA
jgi:aminoglycoside phosphotransferase